MIRLTTQILRSRFAALLVVGIVVATALPAFAAQVMRVRVGEHAKFTRIVFELDRAAGYRVEKVSGTTPALRVTVEAASAAREVPVSGDVKRMKLQAGSRAVAEIDLHKSNLRLQEMILANPPRIVLDLMRPEPVATPAAKPKPKPVAKKPAPKPKAAPKQTAKATPKPAPKPTAKPAPKPTAKAETPKPKPAAKPAAKPAPKPPLAKQPEPKPVAPVAKTTPQAKPEPKPEPVKTPVAPVAKTPAPEAKPKAVAKAETPTAAKPTDPRTTKQPAPEMNTIPGHPEITPTAPVAKPVAKTPAPKPASTTPRHAEMPAAPAEPSWAERLSSPTAMAVIAGVLVTLGVGGFLMARRRRALPNDSDVTAISDAFGDTDAASEDMGRIPTDGFSMGEPMPEPVAPAATETPEPFTMPEPEPVADTAPLAAASDDLFDAPAPFEPAEATPEPVAEPIAPPVVEPEAPALREAPPAVDMSAPSAEPTVEETDSLFGDMDAAADDSSLGDAPMMNQDMDLPADPTMAPSPTTPPPVMGGSAAPDADMSRMFQEFERRMQAMEAKLEEANEAREKLERQVAAQSEELRVQRAAIARTQRALRTMSRADEDKATEPALRDGDTQAKTRVNL
ncbi:MAG: hypothetical protein AAF430_04895 [Myxococcota bacterium]